MKRHGGQGLNYVYFGLLLFFFCFLHLYQILLISEGSTIRKIFYCIYAVGESLLEVGVLVLLTRFVSDRFPHALKWIFIAATGVLFLIHLIDFPLVRIMNWSVWYAIDFVTDETLENIVELLRASNISLTHWLLGGVAMLMLPLLGIVFFIMTDLIARKKPLHVSYGTASISVLAVLLFLLIFDFTSGRLAGREADERLSKALPWKTTFFAEKKIPFHMDGFLQPILDEQQSLAQLSAIPAELKTRPNIYLFIMESIRADFVTSEIAPILERFSRSNISFDKAFASANCTPISWFSLFHSRYPLYWGQMRPALWKSGSLPLRILKQAGYQTHIYSSARLNYYQMDSMLFGVHKELVDSLHIFYSEEENKIYQSDSNCFAKLSEDMSCFANEGGHLFIVFLDSTHFHYSWPQGNAQQFLPVAPSIDYFKVAYATEDLEPIKNRYRNALFYLDSLSGIFLEQLEALPGGKESIVVFMSDHGEEFAEEGCIFHASNLSPMQTEIPIYFRFGAGYDRQPDPTISFVSHIDIFPSLLDYVFGDDRYGKLFDGESIFRPKKKQFAITAAYNASRTPYEFLIHQGQNKVIARFANPSNIEHSKELYLIHKTNEDHETKKLDPSALLYQFRPALDVLFPKESDPVLDR